MDINRLMMENDGTPMEGVVHSMQDESTLRRTNTEYARPSSRGASSMPRGRPHHAAGSRASYWNTVMDSNQPGSSSSSASTAAGLSSSSGGPRASFQASMSFRLSGVSSGSTGVSSRASTSSQFPLRMHSMHTNVQRGSRGMDHSVSGPHICTHCNRQYGSLKELQSHMKRHTRDSTSSTGGSSKYQCAMCPHQFSQRSHLNQHMKTVHAGIRPYACAVQGCTKAFGKRSDLKSHVSSVHENERPFECEFCDRKFAKKSNLSRHREKLHRDKLER